ncbi:MAG: hypothetical protein RL481_280 [Pseudomonadota bacterium]|jgi:uncharacterized protein
MSAAPRLVLFARYPTAGAAKTRLIPALGAEGAAAVHRQLTERTLAVLKATGFPVELHYTGAQEAAFRGWLGDGVTLVPQAEGDLTDRLMAALRPPPVIFFGADTPDLAYHHVRQAIAALETRAVTLGPADDGGYYLIGMKQPMPEILTDIPWSTDQVLPETMRRLTSLGVEPVLLETLHDCDRPEDLPRWPWLGQRCQASQS